jgi:hypothetical protein
LLGVTCHHARGRPVPCPRARTPGLMLARMLLSHVQTIARDPRPRRHGRPPDPATGYLVRPGSGHPYQRAAGFSHDRGDLPRFTQVAVHDERREPRGSHAARAKAANRRR